MTCEHKVRGGFALSLALSRASPAAVADGLGKSSPADSADSPHQLPSPPALEQHTPAAWQPGPQPVEPGSRSPCSYSLQAQLRQLTHSAATAPQAAQKQKQAAAAKQGQGQAHLPPVSPPAPAPLQEQHSHRRRLPFLACFSPGGRVLGDDPSPTAHPAVSASEVGIRPCFYWLESPVSEEDRLHAEANARWLKSDCQVRH